MDKEEFPQELSESLRATFDKYRDLGWQQIELGWPTTSNRATGTVFLHATSPAGDRIHAIFSDDANLAANIEVFFQTPS
jgi:hypothetical protein